MCEGRPYFLTLHDSGFGDICFPLLTLNVTVPAIDEIVAVLDVFLPPLEVTLLVVDEILPVVELILPALEVTVESVPPTVKMFHPVVEVMLARADLGLETLDWQVGRKTIQQHH